MTDVRYPIGRFEAPSAISPEQRRAAWIDELAGAPAALRAAVRGLSAAQLDTPYRPGGWTVRQVVHHVPDSHLQAYTRCKLALTEELPLIKPYDQARWAELSDTRTVDPSISLALLEQLHVRWVALLRPLSAQGLARAFRHPDFEAPQTIEQTIGRYAWHSRHHTAHITALREREGW